MRQAEMTAPGKIEFRDIPEPKPGPGEVLIRIKRIGVCGSDVHVNHGKHPYTSYPVVQGHEFSGVIEKTGEGVADLNPGQKVTATPQIVCGKCKPCLRGDYHICDVLKVEGFQAPGVAQDLFVTIKEKIVPLPENFSFEQGALVEPSAVAVHVVHRVDDLKGKNIVVLGGGPIGNLVAQMAQSYGANVLITDLSDYRLDIAKQCGINNVSNAGFESLDEAINKVFKDEGFDIAFECVGVQSTIEAAINNIGKGGTIVAVGVFAEDPKVNMGFIQDRELNVIGTLMYKYEDYEEAVKKIATGEIKTDALDSKHFPFEKYMDAYQFIDEQKDQCMKVFIDL